MQNVIRKTALARNQAQRKVIRAEKVARRKEAKSALMQRFAFDRQELDNIRAQKKNAREDWLRGPLAPRRDVGVDGRTYGAFAPHTMNPPAIPKHLRRKFFNFVPGDRVCVIRGREKGNIDTITEVNHENETVTLKNTNINDVSFPPWLAQQSQSSTGFNAVALPIPVDDVRLVVPLDNPDTGVTRDVVVEHIHAGEPFLEREYGTDTPKHTRYIAGENIEIPWPRSEVPAFKDEEWDTLRMEVDSWSWTPTLSETPFPPSVMDELRNKYSKYRIRHDSEYVKQKKLEEYKKEYLQSQSMMTPQSQYRAMKQAEKAEAMKTRRGADGNMIMNERTANFISHYLNKANKEARKEGKARG